MTTRAILFDLDGTIGNTLPLCVAAFREAIEPLAMKKLSDDEIIATFGPSEEGIIAALVPDNQTEGLARYLERYEALHDIWPNPFPDIEDLLHDLKRRGVFLGLVTGKGRNSTMLTLKKYAIADYFAPVKTGSASGPVKDIRFEEVIAEYSVSRENILYVGDAPSDIIACRKCSITIAAAAWAPTADVRALESLKPDYLFTSVKRFSDFLENSLDH